MHRKIPRFIHTSNRPFLLHSDVLYKFQDLCPASDPQPTENEDDSTLELTQELDHTPEEKEVTGEWEMFMYICTQVVPLLSHVVNANLGL